MLLARSALGFVSVTCDNQRRIRCFKTQSTIGLKSYQVGGGDCRRGGRWGALCCGGDLRRFMFLFVSVRDGAATAAAAHASVQAEEKRIHINEFLAAVMGLSALTQAAQDEVLIFLLM